jgi:hypothetical protein
MSTLFLLLFLFNSTISADLLNEAIEQDLQVNQNQSLNKELVQPVAPPEKPSKKKTIIKFVFGGGLIIIVLSSINIPVNDSEEKKINNQPVIPPAQSEDIFIKTLESNMEKQWTSPEKNFYKTIGIHYLFGDLLGLLYIYDNYKWIENKGETQWQYNDESNKLTKKINFILDLNRNLENIFTKMRPNPNICWYWNKNSFQDFLKKKLQNQDIEYKEEEDPMASILKTFNDNFKQKDSKTNFIKWASYGLSGNHPLITIDEIWSNKEQPILDNTIEFSTNTYEDGDKKKNIESLYYKGVEKPPEKFLTDLNDYYWPFVEKVFNNLDGISIDFRQQLQSLTTFQDMDESEDNDNIKNLKQIFLSFILEKIKEIKQNLEGSVKQNLEGGQTSLTIQLPNLTWNLSKDEIRPVFSYLLMVYLQFITEKVDKGFQWEEKDKKINQTIFQKIAQTFSSAPKK